MALNGSFTFHGVDLAGAFARVTNVSGGKDGWSVQMSIWATAADAPIDGQPGTGVPALQTIVFSAPYVAGEPALVTAYNTAITLPEFEAMNSDEPNKRISRLEFFQRFTAAERATLYSAAKTNVQIEDYLEQAKIASYIDLSRPDTIGGVQSLETAGIIGAGRAAVILA
jgi:hypothetical protein